MAIDERRPLRVLAADDSAVMREVLRRVFKLHAADADTLLPPMELTAVVEDGIEALEAVAALRPDVLLLDIEMPRLNGIGVLERLRTDSPLLPVIMCSAYTERGARSTLDALAHGAKDYVMKPRQQSDFTSALDLLMEQLLPKIAALATRGKSVSEGVSRAPAAPPKRSALKQRTLQESVQTGAAAERVEIVVIGVSTGGPSALELMLPMLPIDFPVPIMIVQHMPKLFTCALADRLNRLCSLPVMQARHGAVIEPGTIWLAPGDAHMEVALETSRRAAGQRVATVRLHEGPPLNSCMPSVDYLFRSAAERYGSGTLALIMTGMGSDGLEGARAVQQAGGTVLAQDEVTSAVWGMPRRVLETRVATLAVPLTSLAAVLIKRVQIGRDSEERGMSPAAINLFSRREMTHGVL